MAIDDGPAYRSVRGHFVCSERDNPDNTENTMSKTAVALAFAMMATPAFAGEDLFRQELIYLNLRHETAVQETQKALPACSAPAVLPTQPSATATGVTRFSAEWTPTKTFTATLWREACPSDLGISFLYMRVNPSSPAPFICSSSFTATHQDAKERTVLVTQSGTSSKYWCDDLSIPTTFQLKAWTLPHFDPQAAFTLVYDGVYKDFSVSMPAYEPGVVQAVEYRHAEFNHYFFSSDQADISALDSGRFAGWSRTGNRFYVWPSQQSPAHQPVCRFFTEAFAPRSSHFYTAIPDECAEVKRNPDWQYEKIAGFVALADLSGACSVGVKLYRVYNNGMSGAPNHRYTTDKATRDAMIQQGWVPEGYGPDGVIACVAG